jgi:hypothetical protein
MVGAPEGHSHYVVIMALYITGLALADSLDMAWSLPALPVKLY